MKYEIILKEIEVYVLDIEADSEDEALQMAYSKIDSEDGRANYHHDSDGEYEIFELEVD